MFIEQIIEGNKLISEFDKCSEAFYIYQTDSNSTGRTDKYWDTHWEYLMPVLEKIEKMGYGFTIDPWSIQIIEYLSGEENEILMYQKDTELTWKQNYYFAVIDFLKWFKLNPK